MNIPGSKGKFDKNRHRLSLELPKAFRVTEIGPFRHRHKLLCNRRPRIIENRQKSRIFRGFRDRPHPYEGGLLW